MVGAPPTSPTWFAEVGPAPRWVDPGEAWLARQLPARGNRSRKGRSEGSAASPGPCSADLRLASLGCPTRACGSRLPSSLARCARLARQSRRPGALGPNPRWLRTRRASACHETTGCAPAVPLLRAPADAARRSGRRRAEPLGPARRLLLGAARRRGGVRRDHRGDDPPPRLGAGARLRRRLLLRPDVVDARGRRLRLGGPQRAGGAVLRPAGVGRAAPPAPARLAALGGRGVDRDGGAAQRVAVQRHAVGAAGLRGGRHPRGAGARVRRGHRCQPAARAGGGLARCPRPGRHPPAGGRSRPGRHRCRPAGSRTTALGALARRLRAGSPRCRATCRATAPTCWPTSAR